MINMSELKDIIKFIVKWFIWLGLHIFWILPVKSNQIYFRAFHGKKYGCNPKYLFLHIQDNYKKSFECIWEMPSCDVLIPGAACVKRLTVKSFIAMLTSKYIITNNDFMWWIPLRKNQVMLETWHGGGAYKRVGSYEKWSRAMLLDQKKNSGQITYYISSCRKFTEVQSVSKWVSAEKFIGTGMPRNEIFFHPDRMQFLRDRIIDYYHLNTDTKILLYAPTYRGLTGYKEKDLKTELDPGFVSLLNSVRNRFGGNWVLFFRAHYFDSNLQTLLPGNIIDATGYPDMQELLCAADVLVTDFSSSIWDFALTGKPGFLFAPDLQQYIDDRGFYTDPSTWPYPMATTDDELAENIMNFDENKQEEAIKRHLEYLGSYENGNSCQKVLDAIGL